MTLIQLLYEVTLHSTLFSSISFIISNKHDESVNQMNTISKAAIDSSFEATNTGSNT